MKFTDSIEANLEIITELLSGIGPQHRNRAKRAAVAVENVVVRLQRDYPKDPSVALGAAFAIYTLADRLVKAGDGGKSDEGLIKLLS